MQALLYPYQLGFWIKDLRRDPIVTNGSRTYMRSFGDRKWMALSDNPEGGDIETASFSDFGYYVEEDFLREFLKRENIGNYFFATKSLQAFLPCPSWRLARSVSLLSNRNETFGK
ncbi:MAG: hypothetical protein ACD_51C00039G0002 [uncultured bacterium]|nr:MAG: hypothetical protein ACD_51C00039G0002 [uncultured bacterium]